MMRCKRLITICALTLGLVGSTAADAFASHFRYGTITWRSVSADSPNVIDVTVELAFRRTFFPSGVNLGSIVPNAQALVVTGPSFSRVIVLSLRVTALDVAHDWFVGNGVFRVVLPPVNASYRLAIEGCCRTSFLRDDNNDRDFILWSTVNVDMADARLHGSPAVSSIPMIVALNNRLNTFSIPATDPDGDPLSFRLATSAESGLKTQQPQNDTFELSASGVISWTPSSGVCNPAGPVDPGDAGGCAYAIQVVITNARNVSVVHDFILLTINSVGPSQLALTVDGSETPYEVVVPSGSTLVATIAASDPSPAHGVATPITLGSGALPLGSTTTPALPAALTPAAIGAPVTATFIWRTTAADIGAHAIAFTATDDEGVQRTNALLVRVVADEDSQLLLTGLLRDFTVTTGDFNSADGDNSLPLVAATLGAKGKPVFIAGGTATTIRDAASFNNWWSGQARSLTAVLSNAQSGDPSIYSLNTTAFGAGHTFFTWELHSLYTYTAGDVLRYASADDMWVFINGTLAVDLGGVHAAARSATLNVDPFALEQGLVAGRTYRLDLFYAHRGGGHDATVGLESTRPIICQPPLSPTPVAGAETVRSGRAVFDAATDHLRLIRGDEQSLAGMAATSTRHLATNGFVAELDFTITPAPGSAGAEGLAFLLIPTTPFALGGTGRNLGYAAGGATVAIEFDTHSDADQNDPSFQHVSVHARVPGLGSASEADSFGASTNATNPASGTPLSLANGAVHHARIEYLRGTGVNVFIDRHLTPVVSVPLDLAPYVGPSGTVFFGVSTATGGQTTATVEVFNWGIGTDRVSAPQSVLSVPPVDIDANETGHATLQLRNACQSPWTLPGSMVSIQSALGTDDGYTAPVQIRDNLDGTFELTYAPRVGGAPWLLFARVDGFDVLNSPSFFNVSPADPFVTLSAGAFAYDTLPHPATASAQGAFGETLTPVTVTYDGVAQPPIHGGTYRVNATFAGSVHYASKSAGPSTLTITPVAVPTFTVTAPQVTYNGVPAFATAAIAGVGGEPILAPLVSISYDNNPTQPIDAGMYQVVASFAGNRDYLPATATATLAILPAPTTTSVTGATARYDGLAHASTATVRLSNSGVLIPSPEVAITYNGAPAPPLNAGTYAVQAIYAGDRNHGSSTSSATTFINPALLTIRANDASMVEGSAVPLLTASYAGFVAGDTPASLDVPVTLSTAVTPASPPGTYPIVVSSAADVNYAIAFVSGTLTVLPAPPVTLRASKESVRATLAALLPDARGKTAYLLRDAIDEIERSLRPELWRDDSHLTGKGERVFIDEADAVEDLARISPRTPAIRDAIDRLVAIDRELAQIAVAEAVAAHGHAKEIAKANKELREGDERRARGKFDDAIQEYGEAWHRAQKAMRIKVDDDDHGHRCDHRDRRRRS